MRGVDSSTERWLEVPVDQVRPSPYQARRHFGSEALQELSESLRENGMLQPVVVRPVGGAYELVAGERRWRAARMAGLERIPALVVEADDQRAAVLSLVENLQRENLHFLEEAEGYRELIEDFHMRQADLAARIGKSASSVANRLRLLRLPEAVRREIFRRRDLVSERHARALLRLEDEETQLEVLRRVVEEELTVRETERLVEQVLATREDAPASGGGRRQIRVIKDIRIFLNTFRQAVSHLQAAGVATRMEEVDLGEELEVRVRISKRPAGTQASWVTSSQNAAGRSARRG
ncbi:MAG: ParB/RepB/Spo0J family partition protein [Clostridia bacterium]|nr:ParB/RepB/Spo0J family partition protein [Clostridia bacterium]MCL6521865.1 ParB/RepB/Spo0J family partition protein [Bacillota bacterium]